MLNFIIICCLALVTDVPKMSQNTFFICQGSVLKHAENRSFADFKDATVLHETLQKLPVT